MVDIILGRDGLENLRILKERVDVRPLKRVAVFFGSDQNKSVWVSTGSYEMRP